MMSGFRCFLKLGAVASALHIASELILRSRLQAPVGHFLRHRLQNETNFRPNCRLRRVVFFCTVFRLELAFANRSLRQLCENEITAQRQFGEKTAKKLRQRLADLRAAPSAKDIVIGRLKGDETAKPAEITVELCNGYSLSFCPNHNSVPELAPSCIDWARVTRIKILRIEK
jgi:hypothetical protein